LQLQLVADARCERSEQPVGLVVQAGGEEQRVRARRVERGRGEPQPPEPVDRDRRISWPAKYAFDRVPTLSFTLAKTPLFWTLVTRMTLGEI
jgi:hypothetical protein